MILFDVRCQVLEPIRLTDKNGREATVAPGFYRLRGLDHLVRKANEPTTSTGMDLAIVDLQDGGVVYTLSSEKLASLLAKDDVEVKI